MRLSPRLGLFTIERATLNPPHSLHNEHQQQLSTPNLRPFDHERTPLAQLGVCFEQKLFLLVQFQVQNITSFAFASCIDTQPEKFAGCEPVFLAGFECLARLADNLKLVIDQSSKTLKTGQKN